VSTDLQELFHHRWSVPVLSALDAGTGGGRLAGIAYRLSAPRESVRRTMRWLIAEGLVERNPGYGHPLRPEYVLTEAGHRLAPACTQLLEAMDESRVGQLGLNKWSIPIMAILARGGDARFGELRGRLAVSPRALTLALKDLAGAGLIERRVVDGFPPSTRYALTNQATPLRRSLRRLA
jgi:DNA-binding HxlR family transcriptional regulator